MAEYSINKKEAVSTLESLDEDIRLLDKKADEVALIATGLRSYAGFEGQREALKRAAKAIRECSKSFKNYKKTGLKIISIYEKNEKDIINDSQTKDQLLSELNESKKAYKGSWEVLSNLYAYYAMLTGREDLNKDSFYQALDNYPGKKYLKAFDYVSDAYKFFKNIADGDYDSLEKLYKKYGAKGMKEVLKVFGVSNAFLGGFYSTWFINSVEGATDAFLNSEERDKGVAGYIADIFWNATAKSMADTVVDMAMDIIEGGYWVSKKAGESIVGHTLNWTNYWDGDHNDFYERTYEQLQGVFGKDNAEFIREELMFGHCVNEFADVSGEGYRSLKRYLK